MTDKTIHKINEGILIVACCTIFLLCGFALERETASIVWCSLIWIAPIAIYIYECFKESPKYLISKGVMYFIAIQISILVLVHFKYDFFSFGWISDYGAFEKFIFCFLAAAYLAMNYLMIKAFIAHNRNNEESNSITDENEDFVCDELSEDGKLIVDALDKYSQTFIDYKNGLQKINELKIPIPQFKTDKEKSAFADYYDELLKISNKPSFVSFDDFISIIGINVDIDFDKTIFSGIKKSGIVYKNELINVLKGAKDNLCNFVQHPDSNTLSKLFENIFKSIEDDINSKMTWFKYFDTGKLNVPQKLAADIGKGTLLTFIDGDKLDKINSDMIASMKDEANKFCESFDFEIKPYDFNPDSVLDSCTYIPMGAAIKGGAKLVENFIEGDVDISKAAEKIVVDVTYQTSGAYVGNILGTLLGGPLGGVLGGIIGSFVGKKAAQEKKTKDLEGYIAKCKDLENELKNKMTIIEPKIETYRQQTITGINDTARKENEKFENLKCIAAQIDDDKVTLLKVILIICRDYLAYLINNCKQRELKKYLPTDKQINNCPTKCLNLMLSSQTYLKNNEKKEDKYNNWSLINEICLLFIINRISYIKSIQLVRLNNLYVAYHNSMSTIMQTYKNEVNSFVNKVDAEKKIYGIDKLENDITHIVQKIKEEQKILEKTK